MFKLIHLVRYNTDSTYRAAYDRKARFKAIIAVNAYIMSNK